MGHHAESRASAFHAEGSHGKAAPDLEGRFGSPAGMGSIWQKNYRDTLIRDSDHFANAVRYIRRNPAKLAEGSYTLWESDQAAAIT